MISKYTAQIAYLDYKLLKIKALRLHDQKVSIVIIAKILNVGENVIFNILKSAKINQLKRIEIPSSKQI